MNGLNPRQKSLGPVLCALAALCLTPGVPDCPAAEAKKSDLAQKLKENAGPILDELAKRGIRTAGVLKFRVETRPGEVTDNCDFNTKLALRLEAALVLASKGDPAPVGLVRKASDVASGLKGANHLTADGRKRLFAAKYPRAWGDGKVAVDAFITGVAQFQPNRKTVRVNILVVNPETGLKVLTPPFVVTTDRKILAELAGSFHIRGIPDEDPAELVRQSEENPEERFPLQDRPAVELKVFYDGKLAALEFRDGGAWIPEPREGQEMRLELHRLDRGDVPLGVVLKVNGENTLPVEFGRWVLDPGCPPCVIRGFSLDNQRARGFRIASQAESRALAMNYGPAAGMITVAVYQQATAAETSDTTDDAPANADGSETSNDAPDLMAISEAEFPAKPPRNLASLKAQLRANAVGSLTRGIIDKGDEIEHAFDETDRAWEPEPFVSAVIRYYQP